MEDVHKASSPRSGFVVLCDDPTSSSGALLRGYAEQSDMADESRSQFWYLNDNIDRDIGSLIQVYTPEL
jgi:hypothetical protein